MTDEDRTDNADLIWHYTNGPGLLGILNPDQTHIYATDALYLNDTRELLIALEHQVAMMKRELDSEGSDGEITVRGLFKLWFGAALDDAAPAEGVYVTSFCKRGDLLSQWRGYGTGAGFALGFSRSELSDAWAGTEDRLIDVEYSEPNEDLLDRLKPKTLQLGERITLNANAADIAALKDPAFSEEAEVRLVAPPDGREVHFRSGPRGLIPYLKVDFPATCVKEVRLGPGLSDETAVRAVQCLGLERGLVELKVSHSAIPYRS